MKKYRFYTTSEKAWEAMHEAIAAAKSSIYWELYIMAGDSAAVSFLELLGKKASEGVKVKLILDSVGSFDMTPELNSRLRGSGVELLYFNRLGSWWHPGRWRNFLHSRTHRKLLIVDGKIGFIGGVNVGKKYKKWNDIQLRCEGNIVRRFARSFVKSYRLSGGKDDISLPAKIPSKTKLWFLEHWPIHGKSRLKRFYIEKCSQARKEIIVVTPYFIPHEWLMKVLRDAVSRGVRVEVIFPDKTDIKLLDTANHLFANIAFRAGIKFYALPEMMHGKALLVDGRLGMIGSNNLDARSFDYNAEASVFFSEKHLVGDLRKTLEHWKSEAKPYVPPSNPSWFERFLMRVFRFLQPIL